MLHSALSTEGPAGIADSALHCTSLFCSITCSTCLNYAHVFRVTPKVVVLVLVPNVMKGASVVVALFEQPVQTTHRSSKRHREDGERNSSRRRERDMV